MGKARQRINTRSLAILATRGCMGVPPRMGYPPVPVPPSAPCPNKIKDLLKKGKGRVKFARTGWRTAAAYDLKRYPTPCTV